MENWARSLEVVRIIQFWPASRMKLLTPKQVAQSIGVSESSLKRWCDRGDIAVTRTAGGHRRIPLGGVLQFLREKDQPLVRPELLGLPSNTGRGDLVLDRACQELRDALVRGDEEASRRVILDLYLARQQMSVICDQVVAETFHEIGRLWGCGELEVYQERRGCELCARVLHELRNLQPPTKPQAPRAVGGSTDKDPYQLPTAMVEIVLRELGWHATSLGHLLPFDTLQAALEQLQPRLFWLSVSHLEDEEQFLSGYHKFEATALGQGIPLITGGKALTPEVRQAMKHAQYCEDLRDLEAVVLKLTAKTTQGIVSDAT